jgi:prepilin-type processing-associated H-X9-DG protein
MTPQPRSARFLQRGLRSLNSDCFQNLPNGSPSPGGEGRGEGVHSSHCIAPVGVRGTATPELNSYAFTLLELLVIVAVLALLISLRLPALARATDQTKRAQCASNLRQFTLAMHIFANDNNDRLPTSNAGYWAFDIAFDVGTFVESTGSKWTVMYCPGTAPRFDESDNWSFYNYSVPNYRVLGYANTLPGNPGVLAPNINSTLNPVPVQISFGVYSNPLASQRVLLADAAISDYGQSNPGSRYTYNYTDILSGFPDKYTSAHLAGRFPVGGNLGMLDGHVEWRKFEDMTPRTTSTTPTFWW